jgi:hypothetical protein
MKNVTTTRTAVLVVAAFVLGSLGGRWARTAPPPGGGPYEVARRLCARGLCLRVVPAAAKSPSPGAYLTSTDQTWLELTCLPISAAAAARWRGTVLCTEDFPGADLTERDPQRLLRHGGLVFYGDPDLLRQVAEVLRG